MSTSVRSRIVFESLAMSQVLEQAEAAGHHQIAVLLLGETGVGKELVARHIHESSKRSGRFVPVNCGSLTDELAAAELLGRERGAYTGADSPRPGFFEQANGGTILLDEIGDMSLRAQAILLRVLQENEVQRLGGHTPKKIDVMVVAATNRDLNAKVASGEFRLDLLHRLDVFPITVPPLRERPEDILPLAQHFLESASVPGKSFGVTATGAMIGYAWPGNVRQLENVVRRAAVRAAIRSERAISLEDLGLALANSELLATGGSTLTLELASGMRFRETLTSTAAVIVERRVAYCGSMSRASRSLHIAISTLRRLLRNRLRDVGRVRSNATYMGGRFVNYALARKVMAQQIASGNDRVWSNVLSTSDGRFTVKLEILPTASLEQALTRVAVTLFQLALIASNGRTERAAELLGLRPRQAYNLRAQFFGPGSRKAPHAAAVKPDDEAVS